MRLQLEKQLLFLSLLCILSKVRETGPWGGFSLTWGSTRFSQSETDAGRNRVLRAWWLTPAGTQAVFMQCHGGRATLGRNIRS